MAKKLARKWEKEGRNYTKSFHSEERHFPSLGTGMEIKLFNIVIHDTIKVL